MKYNYNLKKSILTAAALLFALLVPQLGKAQYCTPAVSCTSGDYINNFSTTGGITNITNNGTGCNPNLNSYIYYSTMTVTAVQNTTFNVSMQSGPSWSQGFRIWADWNIDGDFADPGEDVYNSGFSGTGVFTGVISVPVSATPGVTRLRVRCNFAGLPSTDPCIAATFGETEDYNIQVNAMVSTPMVYVSSTTTQNVTTNVFPGTTNNEVIGIQVVTTGNLSPFAVTSLVLNSTGTTNFASDVTNVKVWYTGTSGAFATTTLFGSATNLSSPITGTQTLATGTNYFWVTYDLAANALVGNFIDAQATSIVMNGAGGTQTPSVTAPAGNRLINYCTPTYFSLCSSGDYINNVSTTGGVTNFSNLNSGCNGQPNSYMYYSAMNVSAMQTQSFNLTMQSGPSWGQGFKVWIDWNIDGDFTDLGEEVYNSTVSSLAAFTTTITVPTTATPGTTRMRVRCAYATVPAGPCSAESFGETEDYNMIVLAMPQFDAGVQSLSQPLNDNCHGLNETVEVIITNYGSDTIDFALNPLTVNVSVTGPNPFTFPGTPVSGILLPGATMPVLISTTYNMLNPGAYTFTASTTLTGDGFTGNDAMPSAIRNNSKPTVTATGANTVCQNDSTPLSVTATSYGFGNVPQVLSNSTPVNIVDNNTTGTDITVPSSTFNATDLLWVRIDSLTHTYTGELSITLFAPNGTFIDLSSLNGAAGDDYRNTVFIPTATTSIVSGVAPFTGSYLPEVGFSNLGTGSAQGTWKLRVNDNGFGDVGMLWKWTLALPTPNGIVSYSWSPSAGLSSDTIANPMAAPGATTNYIITATDANGCSNVDTVTITVNPLPVVALGADTGICVGGSLVLDAGPGNITYQWSDNSSNQTLTVNTPGTYFVEVMNGNVCFNRDTIDIQVYTPSVNLGNDTAICQNSVLVLDAGTGFATYNWSNMQTGQQINVTSPNTYGVAVTDIHGCPAADTIAVTVNALPVLNLGNDTTFCYLNPLMLDAGNGFTYLWNDSTMSQTLPVSSTGNYYVTITDMNGCENADTISIIANPAPLVNLGLDIVQCGGNVTLNAGNTGSTYMWSNNAATQFTMITQTGTYYVDVVNSFGCAESDTVQVTLYPNPIPVLAEDTTICAGSTILLNGPSGYVAYNWSYNTFTANTQNITVSPGATTTYSLSVTDANGCTTTTPNTVTVFVEQAPQAAFSMTNSSFDVILTNQTTSTVNPTYTWNFGDGSPLDNNVNTAHTYATNGTYMVTLIATSVCGSDTIQQAVVITSLEDAAGALGTINVYPNPNDGVFNLSINGTGNTDLTIDILDIQGKVVHSERENNIAGEYVKELNVSELAKGLYYLRLTTGNAMRMEKIIIQ